MRSHVPEDAPDGKTADGQPTIAIHVPGQKQPLRLTPDQFRVKIYDESELWRLNSDDAAYCSRTAMGLVELGNGLISEQRERADAGHDVSATMYLAAVGCFKAAGEYEVAAAMYRTRGQIRNSNK